MSILAVARQTSPLGLVARADTTSVPGRLRVSRRSSNDPLGAFVRAVVQGERAGPVLEHDAPAHAYAVLIDLELDLDPAVLGAQLQLRGARPGSNSPQRARRRPSTMRPARA